MASTWLDPYLSRVLLYLYYLVFVYFVFVSFYICVFLYLCICHLRKVPASTWLAPCLPPAKMFRIFLELAATPAQRMSSPRITGQFCSQRFEAGSENREEGQWPTTSGCTCILHILLAQTHTLTLCHLVRLRVAHVLLLRTEQSRCQLRCHRFRILYMLPDVGFVFVAQYRQYLIFLPDFDDICIKEVVVISSCTAAPPALSIGRVLPFFGNFGV